MRMASKRARNEFEPDSKTLVGNACERMWARSANAGAKQMRDNVGAKQKRGPKTQNKIGIDWARTNVPHCATMRTVGRSKREQSHVRHLLVSSFPLSRFRQCVAMVALALSTWVVDTITLFLKCAQCFSMTFKCTCVRLCKHVCMYACNRYGQTWGIYRLWL